MGFPHQPTVMSLASHLVGPSTCVAWSTNLPGKCRSSEKRLSNFLIQLIKFEFTSFQFEQPLSRPSITQHVCHKQRTFSQPNLAQSKYHEASMKKRTVCCYTTKNTSCFFEELESVAQHCSAIIGSVLDSISAQCFSWYLIQIGGPLEQPSWRSWLARQSHNLKVVSSSLTEGIFSNMHYLRISVLKDRLILYNCLFFMLRK